MKNEPFYVTKRKTVEHIPDCPMGFGRVHRNCICHYDDCLDDGNNLKCTCDGRPYEQKEKSMCKLTRWQKILAWLGIRYDRIYDCSHEVGHWDIKRNN